MNLNNQNGFSLIELLVTFVIIGILAAISFPYLIKTKNKAKNSNAFVTTRTLFSSDISFYTDKGR